MQSVHGCLRITKQQRQHAIKIEGDWFFKMERNLRENSINEEFRRRIRDDLVKHQQY